MCAPAFSESTSQDRSSCRNANHRRGEPRLLFAVLWRREAGDHGSVFSRAGSLLDPAAEHLRNHCALYLRDCERRDSNSGAIYRNSPPRGGYAFILYYPAVTISALLLDRGTGLYAAILSAFLTVLLFIEPRFTLIIPNQADTVALFIFLACSVVITVVAEFFRLLLERLDAMEREKGSAVSGTGPSDPQQPPDRHVDAGNGARAGSVR